MPGRGEHFSVGLLPIIFSTTFNSQTSCRPSAGGGDGPSAPPLLRGGASKYKPSALTAVAPPARSSHEALLPPSTRDQVSRLDPGTAPLPAEPGSRTAPRPPAAVRDAHRAVLRRDRPGPPV